MIEMIDLPSADELSYPILSVPGQERQSPPNLLPSTQKTKTRINTGYITTLIMIMEEPTLRRIAVDREVDWLTVQDNVTRGLQSSLDARLATLPGGRDGPAAKGVKRELEERIKKVCTSQTW
jgi:hypothetical protein